MKKFSTAVTITDPLVKYQSMLSTGALLPDPAQHRLARHLRTVYHRVKDYSPQLEFRQRLQQVRELTEPCSSSDRDILAVRTHSIWRNPLFKHLLPSRQDRDSLALTRVLANHETAIEIDSPKGLFLSGEVGTGKSMLLDLLADGLPTERKRRWHFNTFMLHTFAQLEKYRASMSSANAETTEHSLLWMGKKLVDESPILFLDEFQLPDRAASKILSHLFISFFQLGGVLIASSNRMSEDLDKATGVDYATEPRYGKLRKMFGGGLRSELYGQSSDFSKLLEVLKARCDFWQMGGAQDWRRREQVEGIATTFAEYEGDDHLATIASEPDKHSSTTQPSWYTLNTDAETTWSEKVLRATGCDRIGDIPWKPETLVVYGRGVLVPKHYNGVVAWNFGELVASFGPADYITMASSFHTFIVDEIPTITVLQKNEARRFITFLDALYEARCRLIIRAEKPPDSLFFPKGPNPRAKSPGSHDEGTDAIYSETIAEVYQDQTSPFRPNVSYYDTKTATSRYNDDQDSDFGLDQPSSISFGNTSAFTGEDERFAYKRATSRLWELCSDRWHTRTGNWWQPLPLEERHWEKGPVSRPLQSQEALASHNNGEKVGESVEIDEVAGLSRYRIEQLQKQVKES